MTTEITEPGLYDGIDNADYHADPVKAGSLSVSGAKKLLDPYCPAIYKHERENPVYKDIFDIGSAAHKLVLGDEATVLEEIDADDYKTKAAREQRDLARVEGRVPVLPKELATVEAMAGAVRNHPAAMALLDTPGKPEQSAFWIDDRTGVWRRARFDWLPEVSESGQLVLTDYKTAASASKEKFSRAAADYGYDMQVDWYTEAARALGLAEDIAFVFIVQEKTAPYLVNVVQLDLMGLRCGRNRNTTALDIYKHCIETGTWPGYGSDVQTLSLPPWHETQYGEIA